MRTTEPSQIDTDEPWPACHEGYVTLQTAFPNIDTLFSESYVFSAAYGASTAPDLSGYQTALGPCLTDSATTNRLLDVPLYVAIGTGDTAITGNA